MKDEEMLKQMLEKSHRRGEQRIAEMEKLTEFLHDHHWRRQGNRYANLLGVFVFVVVILISYAWVPTPEYGSYFCTHADASSSADYQVILQMLAHQ